MEEGNAPYAIYGLLPQSKSSQTSSIVPNPQSVILTVTPFPLSACSLIASLSPLLNPPSPFPSITMKFSGLISLCEIPTSWHA